MQVYGLNAKIAELESDMHDVIRELTRTNLDVQNFRVSGLTGPRVDLTLFDVPCIYSSDWGSHLDVWFVGS